MNKNECVADITRFFDTIKKSSAVEDLNNSSIEYICKIATRQETKKESHAYIRNILTDQKGARLILDKPTYDDIEEKIGHLGDTNPNLSKWFKRTYVVNGVVNWE